MLLLPSYSTWRFTTTGRDCTSSVDGLDSLAWRLDLQATAMTPVGSGGNIGKADLPPSLTHILDGDSRCSWKAINYHQLSWHVAWTLRKKQPSNLPEGANSSDCKALCRISAVRSGAWNATSRCSPPRNASLSLQPQGNPLESTMLSPP